MRNVPTLPAMVAVLLPLTACLGDGTPPGPVADRLAEHADRIVVAAGSGDGCAVQRAVDAFQSALGDVEQQLRPVDFDVLATDAAALEQGLTCVPPAPSPSPEPSPEPSPDPPPPPPPANDGEGDDDDDDDGRPGRGRGRGGGGGNDDDNDD